MSATQKDGASISPAPVRFATGSGSLTANDVTAKIRALFDAMGGKPMIVRFSDDRAAVLSAEALQIVHIPLSHGEVQ